MTLHFMDLTSSRPTDYLVLPPYASVGWSEEENVNFKSHDLQWILYLVTVYGHIHIKFDDSL